MQIQDQEGQTDNPASPEELKTTAPQEGWGFPARGRKWHYFVGIVSLCRRWMYSGYLEGTEDNRTDEDCVLCVRTLPKHIHSKEVQS